ncbi:MAG: tyrosine-type recombinase/integrase [Methanococcoides sp.]|nr:tyrosine-type recombinase/integrase [Methanococcoides sp.]
MTRKDPVFEGQNKEIIEEYIKAAKLKNKKQTTISGELWQIASFVKSLDNKDLRAVTKDDIEAYYLQRRDNYKPSTVHMNMVIVRLFYNWFIPDNTFFERIKTRQPKNKLPVNELVFESDVMELLSGCNRQRDRALISLLWDSAARIGELLSLNISNIEFNNNGGVIIVSGKTGMRRIALILSVPELRIWLNQHPYRDDPNAPLFVTDRKYDGTYRRLTIEAVGNLLSGVVQRACVKKNIHPHAFRHGRLTDLAKRGFNEMELRIIAGWEANSNMPATYLHLSGADVESKLLAMHGIIKEEDVAPKLEMMPKDCPVCKTANTFDAKFCVQCGQALDAKAAQQLQATTQPAEDGLAEFMGANLESLIEKLLNEKLKNL